MDRFIEAMPAEYDDDLMLCRADGVAFQRDRAHRVVYGSDYWDKLVSYEGKEIARKINEGRVKLVNDFVGGGRVCDVGIGSGEFIKNRPNTYGTDVNPIALQWLHARGVWAGRLDWFAGLTFWDVIEHIETPEDYFSQIPLHGFLFTSIPMFIDLDRIRESRHYRPGEHLQYFTEKGFRDWMALHGFMVLDQRSFETDAGRDSIQSFAFKRYRNT